MKKQRFEDWEYSQINKEFGYKRYNKGFRLLEEWLAAEAPISEFEQIELIDLSESLLLNAEVWNEDELKFMFISPLMRLVKFNTERYKIFTQRRFSAVIGEWELNGIFDFIVSQGEQHPEQPYFFLHEYKQERKKENDPLGQLLAAMLVAQHKNEVKFPLYGCYVVGRSYFFVVLDGKKYGVSNALNASDEDIFQIFKMMRSAKQSIEELVEKNQNN